MMPSCNFNDQGKSLSFITFLKQQSQKTETWAKQAVLRAYVKNQAKLELILFYRASKYKQTKRPGY